VLDVNSREEGAGETDLETQVHTPDNTRHVFRQHQATPDTCSLV
jgi:hypothetical protein